MLQVGWHAGNNAFPELSDKTGHKTSDFSFKWYNAAVPHLFGARDWCSYGNRMPDDLRWSWGAVANTDKEDSLAFWLLTSVWPSSQQAQTGPGLWPEGLGTLV